MKPVSRPAFERRRRRQRQQQRQVAPQRRHHANARVGVAEASVDVHPAHKEAPYALLVGDGEAAIALTRSGGLCRPLRERMHGCGHRRRAVPFGGLHHQPSRLDERRAQIGYGLAHPRVGFDLRAQELGNRLVLAGGAGAGLEDGLIGIGDHIAGIRIDEERTPPRRRA